MRRLLIVIRFALVALSLVAVLATAVESTGWGQTNSQWNTTSNDGTGWLTTSKDDGGDGPRSGGDGPRSG